MNRIELKRRTSIEDDFALWAGEQAALVRERFDRADADNIAGELEHLGSSQQSEIESRLNILIAHLLKWQFQPSKRGNSWRAALLEQRTQIGRILRRSPSLKGHPGSVLDEEYQIGRLKAAGETMLPETAFPRACPYTIEQILDLAFFPGGE